MISHITENAITCLKIGNLVKEIKNQNGDMCLTMSFEEIKSLETDFFIDILDVIDNNLMANLLNHFRDEGVLFNAEDLSRY